MAEFSYMQGRRKYARPQALLFSESAPVSQTVNDVDIFLPPGVELGSSDYSTSDSDFLILSDHNRSDIIFNTQRIERRERTVNGRMRSYHIADKLSISTSWTNLPSRSFSSYPEFSNSGTSAVSNDGRYTVDGGAGGAELLDWYENHTGSFWVYIAYDNPNKFKDYENPYSNLAQYTDFLEVFFADFQFSVSKRGANTHDFWEVSLTLEEV